MFAGVVLVTDAPLEDPQALDTLPKVLRLELPKLSSERTLRDLEGTVCAQADLGLAICITDLAVAGKGLSGGNVKEEATEAVSQRLPREPRPRRPRVHELDDSLNLRRGQVLGHRDSSQ